MAKKIVKIFLGNDPGLSSGCLAVGKLFDDESFEIETFRYSKVTGMDIIRQFRKLEYFRIVLGIPIYSYMEKVRTRGMNGTKSNWTMGASQGQIFRDHAWAGLTVEEVGPKVWQAHFGAKRTETMTQSAWKKSLRDIAEKIYPTFKMVNDEADAILLMRYSYDKYN